MSNGVYEAANIACRIPMERSKRNHMTSPTPKLKSNELIERLNNLPEGNGREFGLRQLFLEARQLVKVDAARAYMIMGMVSSELGDVEACRQNFKAALALSSDILIKRNYSSALIKAAFLEEGADLALENARRFPGDIEILQEAVHACLYSGRLNEAKAVAETLRAMMIDHDIVENLDIILSLPDGVLEYYPVMCKTVAEVMRAHKVVLSLRSVERTSDDQVVIRYYMGRSPKFIADFNMDLADAIVQVDPFVGNNLLFMGCPANQ